MIASVVRSMWMARFWLFGTCMAAATFFALSTFGRLPQTVATHFATNGAPDGWTKREDYRNALVLILTLLPMFVVWLMAGLPRILNGRGMIPNSDYWFAPERRKATGTFLLAHAVRLGILTMAAVIGIHIMILRANTSSPPTLNVDQLTTMIAVFLVGLGWWFFTLLRHFQKIDS